MEDKNSTVNDIDIWYIEPLLDADGLQKWLPCLGKPKNGVASRLYGYKALRDKLLKGIKLESGCAEMDMHDVVYMTYKIRSCRKDLFSFVERKMHSIGASQVEKGLLQTKSPFAEQYLGEGWERSLASNLMSGALDGKQKPAREVERLLRDSCGTSLDHVHKLAVERFAECVQYDLNILHAFELQRQSNLKQFRALDEAKARLLEQRSNEAIAEVPCWPIFVIRDALAARPADNAASSITLTAETVSANTQ